MIKVGIYGGLCDICCKRAYCKTKAISDAFKDLVKSLDHDGYLDDAPDANFTAVCSESTYLTREWIEHDYSKWLENLQDGFCNRADPGRVCKIVDSTGNYIPDADGWFDETQEIIDAVKKGVKSQ